MAKPRIHWRPNTPISYPSGPGNMRTFVLRDNVVCHAETHAVVDWAIDLKWVTCKRCLRIGAMHRVDTEATIRKVLTRPDVEPAPRVGEDGGR